MIKNAFRHFNKICKHKFWVGIYCFKAGIPWQGIKHDLSKFSPIEFFESVKYYDGTRSPIDKCKEENAYSACWLHHKGRNPHHYEYWVDNYDKGGNALIMPYKYAVELICDYIGAGRAYMGKDFSYGAEYDWWIKKQEAPLLMAKETKIFISFCLNEMNFKQRFLTKEELKHLYNNSLYYQKFVSL